MILFLTSIITILAANIIVLFVKKEKILLYNLILISLSSFLGILFSIKSYFFDEFFSLTFKLIQPLNDISLRVDKLSLFFVFIIYLGGFLSTLYGVDYLKKYQNYKTFKLLIFSFNILLLSMVLLPILNSALPFLIVWEIMSISSFFCILLENDKKETLKSGIKYFVYMHIGFLLILIGFLFLELKTGSSCFSDFYLFFKNPNFTGSLIFLILFVGFGIKAGLIPFHSWLVDAHPASPSNVSGFMSGLMIKMGIYGILRFLFFVEKPNLFLVYPIFIISIITGILGILFSTFEKDLKKILAYSSIENIGIIGIGISLFLIGKYLGNILISTLAISGTFIHIFNHSIFKPLLFYGTGNIYAKTHTKNIEELGGLIKLMPKTSYMMILGSAAITGLPLLSGFFGELLLYLSSVLGIKENSVAISFLSFVSIFSLSLIGSFALISFTKFSGITLLGLQRKPSEHEIKEDMKFSLSSMYILTTLMLLSGFFIPFVYRLFYKLINFYLKSSIDFSFTNEILFKVFVVYIIFIGIFVILFLIRELLLKNKKIYIEKVWDCGYQNGNIKMQYTASSYVQTLKNLFSILLIEKSHKDEIKDYFPGEKILKEERRDIFEKFLFSPSLNFLKNFFDMVSGIQKGSTQKYLLMGFLFIIISFLILLKV